MKLRYKTGLIIFILFALITISEFLIQRFIVFPAFISLEEKEADNNMNRVVEALNNEISHLDNLCNDWATWNDSYDYIDTRSDDYINSNLPDWIFHETGLNLIYIIDQAGQVAWGKIYDNINQKEIFIDEIPTDYFPENYPLINICDSNFKLSDQKLTGVFNTEMGPLLFATEIILTGEAKGPARGYMVMGMLINENTIKKLVDQTKVNFEIFHLYKNPDLHNMEMVIEGLKKTPLYIEKNNNREQYNLYSYYNDTANKPSLIIKTDFPRNISLQGARIIRFATTTLIISGIIVILIVLIMLNRFIINPIYKLDKHMISIIETEDFSIRISSKRKDEIGDLTKEFDFFISKIQNQRDELKKLSTIDSLTNIANRRQFDETLESELNRHKRYTSPFALLLIDIDYFKNFNDCYGHQAGDNCLVKVGNLLLNRARRAGELAARYGGEEFALIYSNVNEEDIVKISKLLLSDIKKLNIKHEDSDIADYVTFSIGIAICIPDEETKSKDIIEMADKALYRAKETGRNKFVNYSEIT